MKFSIEWHGITLSSSKADWSNVLYAYVEPYEDTIVYIGKADRQTIRQRLSGTHKDKVWRDLAEAGVDRYALLAGDVTSDADEIGRFTWQMLADIESLLIYRLKPIGNIQNTRSRPISRPGMTVSCEGVWPHRRTEFRDI